MHYGRDLKYWWGETVDSENIRQLCKQCMNNMNGSSSTNGHVVAS